jgi:predicted transcriptional regulator
VRRAERLSPRWAGDEAKASLLALEENLGWSGWNPCTPPTANKVRKNPHKLLDPALNMRKNPHMSSKRSRLLAQLSRRERQIIEIVYARGSVSAADVQGALSDAPGYSAVRSALRLLEQKGLLRHRAEGLKYLYEPTLSGEQAGKSALRRVIETFFQNSAGQAVQTLLAGDDLTLTAREIAEIETLIAEAKKKGTR